MYKGIWHIGALYQNTCLIVYNYLCMVNVFKRRVEMVFDLYIVWIDTLLLSRWNGHPCRNALSWNQQLNLFDLKSTFLRALVHVRCMKFTLPFFLSEINIHAVTYFKMKWHSNLFWPEINIFELARCAKLTLHFFLSETDILAVKSHLSLYFPIVFIWWWYMLTRLR